MSYAIETKKRKFERILESLTDGASSQSRITLNSRNNNLKPGSSISTLDTFKKRRLTPTAISKTISTSSLAEHYLPSSRPAFLERLATYRQVTKWHIPSTEPVNASVWAKRGWVCVDTDIVFCGACKERLQVDLEIESKTKTSEHLEETEDTYALGKDMHDGLVKRYEELVITSHADSCPWRKRGSDSSIQRLEGLLNTNDTISALKTRYESLAPAPQGTPPVVPLPDIDERELIKMHLEGEDNLNLDRLRLAVCGWQKKSEDVIECRHCFRSLGLWLYRGDDPTMENLDAVDSHLDYCPWRSRIAQDTEIMVNKGDERQKQKFAGWELVYQAIVRHVTPKQSLKSKSTVDLTDANSSRPSSSESMTPEQREKRRLDLMKRIKDLKKPFNVKGMLGRKKTVIK